MASAEPLAAAVAAPSFVSVLLKRSRAHAANRQRLANQTTGTQHTPRYGLAEIEADRALSLRLQAHELDPEHTDPAWAEDTVPHERIVAFLQRYAEIP